MTYNYLTKYDSSNYEKIIPIYANRFFKVEDHEILEAEELLGYKFPDQLRQFYQQVGEGRLMSPHNPPPDYSFGGINEILPPMVVARFTKGIYEWEGQDHWISMETVEDLAEGDMPFFEIGDSCGFMVFKPLSKNPNAVYVDGSSILIEDSFEKFIWRLYYEDPGYYGDIIDKHYQNL